MSNKFYLILFVLCSLAFSTFGQVPSGYYDGADGKSGADLKTSLFQIIHNYVSADYDGFTAVYWGNNYFVKTDWNSAGYFWDMYSDEQRTTYNSSLMSREHCMPRSWWEVSDDYGVANSDLHNLYPSDYTANSKKSNYPLGEVGTASWTNGVVKLGANTYSGYSGTVFEPADEYKGDFARTYFYMVTCHEDYSNRWSSPMLNNNTYPVFQTWAINMLLDWARHDPVSQKEIDRNNAVFEIQQNRNPFIDNPDLLEYIWGTKVGENFTVEDKVNAATLITPTDGKSIDFGTITISSNKTRVVPIKTLELSGNLSLEWVSNTSGYFSIHSNSISSANTNLLSGDTLNITYSPLVAGNHTAQLHIFNTENGISSTISLSGTASDANIVDPVVPDEDAQVIFFYTGPWVKDSLPSNFATNIASPYVYSNGDLRYASSGNYLTVSFDQTPDCMRFAIYPRNAWGTNQNHLYVYEGTTVSTIEATPIADFDNTFVTNGDSYNNTSAIPLKETTRAIKIQYQKVSQNVGITNLFVTLKEASAINSSKANFITMIPSNGGFLINGISGTQVVIVYDLLGKILYKGAVQAGSLVPFVNKGIFIVKIGNYVQKLSI